MTPLDPRRQLPEKVVEALKAGNVVLAVKLLRELKGIGLKEARDLLVAVRDGLPVADKPAAKREPLPDNVQRALDRGSKVEAIRLLREKTGQGVKESKDAIDRIVASLPGRPTASGSKRPTGLAPGEVPRTDGMLWRVVVGIALTLLAYWYLSDG